jgi:hypothetical protein
MELPAASVAIIGGYAVDRESAGVYEAQVGPGRLHVTVQDGFIAVVNSTSAQKQWCDRLDQAKQSGWAMAHQHPQRLEDRP